jgi:hypothetical protein
MIELHGLPVILRNLMGRANAGVVVEIHRVDRAEAQGLLEML